MAVEYQEIRTELEADGFRLDDEEYTEAVNYARRISTETPHTTVTKANTTNEHSG